MVRATVYYSGSICFRNVIMRKDTQYEMQSDKFHY